MNIFVTSTCPIESAKFLDDKRVIKMCAESVQILVTVLHLNGMKDTPIKPTHAGHPCVKWASSSRANYKWLLRHTVALMHEKRRRYPDNKPHLYEQHINFLRNNSKRVLDRSLTPFVNCAANSSIGVSYKHLDDITIAYQLYLNDRWDTDKREPTWHRISR